MKQPECSKAMKIMMKREGVISQKKGVITGKESNGQRLKGRTAIPKFAYGKRTPWTGASQLSDAKEQRRDGEGRCSLVSRHLVRKRSDWNTADYII